MKKLLSVLVVSASLVSCGGGGSGGVDLGEVKIPSKVPGAISGTAAVGAPLADAIIKIRGDHCSKSGKANAYGVYTVALDDCGGPYIISAESKAGKAHSVATSEDVGQIVNSTPLTTLIATRVLKTTDIETADPSSFDANKVEEQVTAIQTAISALLDRFGASSVDIRSGVFAADGKALDRVLDAVNVKPTAAGDMAIEIKGTATSITVKPDPDEDITPIDPEEVDEAESSMTEFDHIKNFMLTDYNNCLATKSFTCYQSFYHSEYLNHGHEDLQVEWDDIYWAGMELTYSNLILIHMNDNRDTAWVAFTAKERGEDGKMYNWVDVTQLKKEASNWKIYGNQVPQMVELQPSLLKDVSQEEVEVVRGVNFRSTDWWSDKKKKKRAPKTVAPFTFSFKSSDFGIDNEINVDFTNEGRFVVGDSTPSCASENVFCQSFLQTDEAQPANFPKVTLKFGATPIEIYVPTLPTFGKNQNPNTLPGFAENNLKHDSPVCSAMESVSDFPSNLDYLRFAMPAGYIIEGFDMSSKMNMKMDIEWEYSQEVIPFGAALTEYTYNPEEDDKKEVIYQITDMDLGIEFRNASDRPVFLIYSCQAPI